jgi:EAL and modified HD-GYP domain-containing signal transduction protein
MIFFDTPDWASLIEIADFHKVDFRIPTTTEQRALAARYAEKRCRMLTERVETPEEFSEALAMGNSLFQGYFFAGGK